MSELLTTRKQKARRDHRCDYCALIITKGTIYDVSTMKYDGDLYRWINHIECHALASKLKWFDNCDEGLTGDDFRESLHEEYRQIMIATDIELYESKDFKYPTYKEQLIFVMKHHGL